MTEEAQQQPRRQRRQGLTDRQIAAKQRRPQRYTEADPEQRGLYLRIPSSGPIVFAVAERNPYGTKVWAKLGTTADMTIDEARERARTAIRRIKDGLTAFEAVPDAPQSYSAVAQKWLEQHVEKEGLRTGLEIRRLLERVLVFWGKKDFVSIRRKDISDLLDVIEQESGPWAADHILSVTRKISRWYASRSDDYTSPFVAGMRRTRSEARARDRILDEAELRQVWKAAEANGAYGALIRLLLLTAQRRDKLITMKWSDLKPGGIWEIASEVREKGNAGAVRLPPLALKIIRAQPQSGNNPFVFAAGRGDGPMSGFNKRKASFDEACGIAKNWTLHDLRRTARSLMSAAGVINEHAERVLGHKLGGVRGVYDRHEYFEEKSAALVKLAAEIKRIVTAAS
jgi:integrase